MPRCSKCLNKPSEQSGKLKFSWLRAPHKLEPPPCMSHVFCFKLKCKKEKEYKVLKVNFFIHNKKAVCLCTVWYLRTKCTHCRILSCGHQETVG